MPSKPTHCPHCKQPVKLTGKKKEPTIFHLSNCKPAKTYLKDKKQYQIEVEMPGILHGGYL